MASVTSANNSETTPPPVDPMERATSLQSGRHAGLYVMEITAEQMPQFLLGWAACAEAARRECARPKDRDDLSGQADVKESGPVVEGFDGRWPNAVVAVRPSSMREGASRYRKPRKRSKKGGRR